MLNNHKFKVNREYNYAWDSRREYRRFSVVSSRMHFGRRHARNSNEFGRNFVLVVTRTVLDRMETHKKKTLYIFLGHRFCSTFLFYFT